MPHPPASETVPANGSAPTPPPVARARVGWGGIPVAGWAVVLVALAVRLHLAWQTNHRLPNGPARLIHGDEPSYNSHALNLLHHGTFGGIDRVPLYPAWLALIHWISGENYNAVPYVQAFVGAATVLLLFILTRRYFGTRPALVASGLASVSFVLTRQTPTFLSEALFTPALLTVVLALGWAIHQPSTRRFVLAGIAVGLTDLIRPTLLFFPFFVLLALPLVLGVRRGARMAMVYAAAAFVTIAPWTVRNYVRVHAFVPLATSNAALWLGSPEYYHLVRDSDYTYARVWDDVIYPDDPSVPYPGTPAGERYWSARAKASIFSEPLVALRFDVEKLFTYWVGSPNADWADTHVFNYAALRGWGYSKGDAARVMLERALPLVALVLGVAVLWRRWRELLPIFLLLLYCNLLHAATVARARMSEPLQPFLLALLAGALFALARRAAARRRASAPAERGA